MIPINTLRPFTKFCMTIGELPSSYLESITYYEQLLWLCNYLQCTIIPTVNNNAEAVTELQDLYTELKKYVDDYFKDLDVQDEINNKLDSMVSSGELSQIIGQYMTPIVDEQNAKINNQNTQINNIEKLVQIATSGSPAGVYSTLADLQNANPDHNRIYLVQNTGEWYYYNTTSNSWTSGGVYQSSEVSENDKVIIKINNNLNMLNNCFKRIIGKNLFDGQTRIGGYDTTTGEYNPNSSNTSANVNPIYVKPNTTYYISNAGTLKNVILIQYDSSDNVITSGNTNTFTTNENTSYINFYAGSLSGDIMISSSSDLTYEPYNVVYELQVNPTNEVLKYISENIQNSTVINELINNFDKIPGKNLFDGQTRNGGYNIESGEYNPSSSTTKANVNPLYVIPNTTYYISNDNIAINLIVFQYDLNNNLLTWSNANNITTLENTSYINFYGSQLSNKTMISTSNNLNYEPYKYTYELSVNPNQKVLEYISSKIGNFSLLGKTICNIGDSLWGNYEGDNSLSGIIKNITGATTYNCGFGGCRMTYRTDSPYWNAFSMVTLADAIASGNWTQQETALNNKPSGMPDYFDIHLNTLKNIDFSKLDILTIGFGVNDYMGGQYVENPNNLYDKSYINGALRYSIETISKVYPNICIVIVSPNFAVWFENNEIKYTSNEKYYNNNTDVTLPDVVNGLNNVSKEYNEKFIDVYHNIGNNKFTAKYFFAPPDGVHPNNFGINKMGRYIAYELIDQ